MFIVTIQEPDRIWVKNKIFQNYEEAQKYASSVAPGTKVAIWQNVLPKATNPSPKGES